MEHISSDCLKSERKRLQFTQQTLANALGVSDMTVKRWEAGAPIPSDKLTILDSLGFDILLILTGRSSKSNTNVTYGAGCEFAHIPVRAVTAAAGHGSKNDDENILYHFAYRKDWLKSRGLFEKDLEIILVRGDSMEPTISDGESILVNTVENEPQDGHIYVIRSGDTLWVKRVQRMLDGSLSLISDNNMYAPMRLDLDASNDVQVIGKVVNSSKNFY
ncbi:MULTISPECIES: S24 family peptidase [Acinetobacter]|uniref:Helix-turn-helix domain-containing protein n=1 Tax=Acinetobacter guerrae TaxID=1843371 RepID=A0A3A8E470_9GAMM|nr:S24 family peptidase [Acinetobacter guerrae]RKG29862.1 helix-turn-helix domain-containing protein [Acinetobacter guerrae]